MAGGAVLHIIQYIRKSSYSASLSRLKPIFNLPQLNYLCLLKKSTIATGHTGHLPGQDLYMKQLKL